MSKPAVRGIVAEILQNALFRVSLDNGRTVRAHASTELKRYSVRLLPGERVAVELSTHDDSRGRIVRVEAT